MDDDFNTGGAMGVLFDLVRTLNKFADDEKLENRQPDAAQVGRPAARRGDAARAWAPRSACSASRPKSRRPAARLVGKLMKLVIELRAEARAKKDFATADRIRKVLTEVGVALEDRPGGTEYTIK